MKLRVITQKHPCNGCTVCCEVIAVHELGKPFYARCEHQREDSCGTYESRPQGCRDFVCSWAAGFLGDSESWRPDALGILFSLRHYPDGLWLEIFEAAAGAAADGQRIDYLAQRIIARVEKFTRIAGTRLHHFGDKIALGFDGDQSKYPASAGVSRKMSRYRWIDGDPRRQVFLEAHDPP
jgi:hypothetical protein